MSEVLSLMKTAVRLASSAMAAAAPQTCRLLFLRAGLVAVGIVLSSWLNGTIFSSTGRWVSQAIMAFSMRLSMSSGICLGLRLASWASISLRSLSSESFMRIIGCC